MTTAAPPTLATIDYPDFLRDIESVARRIETSEWVPDFLVGIGRGGHVPAAFLSHRTGLPMLSVDHSSKVFEFADALLVRLAERMRQGQRILFVDDINDSGATITYLRETIAANGGIAEHVRFAVLINNIRSRAQVEYWSREINRDRDKQWFVFPWESVAARDKVIEEAESVPERLA